MINDNLSTHLKVLQKEIEILKGRVLPEDTGHIHTTIRVLEDRVEEIYQNIIQQSKTRNMPT